MRAPVLATFLLLGSVPLAAAHCTASPWACPGDAALEEAVRRANLASDGDVVVVLLKDRAFHPTVVEVADGGTVVFVDADVERPEAHDPRGSGACSDGADPLLDPEGCVPSLMGVCFNSFVDQGGAMHGPGASYSVTFQYVAASQLVRKSHGALSDTALGALAEPFRDCPPGTAPVATPTEAVVPYHCGNHGLRGFGTMRGTLVLRAGPAAPVA